jgi:O-antigen/teichoic acid export membrane protein
MDRTDRIARHTFEVLLSMVVIGALQYSFKISMARMLTVSGYGLLSTVEPIVVLTGSFFLSGFAVALSKFVSEEIAKDNKKTAENYIATALYYIFPLAIGVSIVMILLSDTIAELIFHEPNLGILIRIIVLILPVEALWLILDGIFLGCQESPYYTYVLLIYNALVLCGALFLVSRGISFYHHFNEFRHFLYYLFFGSCICGIVQCSSSHCTGIALNHSQHLSTVTSRHIRRLCKGQEIYICLPF